MPVREEVPRANQKLGSKQSLAELAKAAFENGAHAVGQSGADVKDPRSVDLPNYPMMGRASNLVQAHAQDFGPIEVFGEQRPFIGSPQLHGELTFPGVAGNFISTDDAGLNVGDFEVKDSLPDAVTTVFAGPGNDLEVGELWAGVLRSYLRHGGVDDNAPIVARLDPIDMRSTLIADGQTFMDAATGRVWTIHGDDWAPDAFKIVKDIPIEFPDFEDFDAAARLDGQSGTFVSTEDINLLSADAAHMHQSGDAWNFSTGGMVVAKDSDPSKSFFGSGSVKITPASATTEVGANSSGNAGGRAATVQGNQQISSQYLYTDSPGLEARSRVRWGNGSTVTHNGTYTAWTPIVPGEFLQLSVVDAAPDITNDFAILDVRYRLVAGAAPPADSDIVWISAGQIANGTDPTFVPSLRIVNKVEWEADLAPVTWSPAGQEIIVSKLQAGAASHGYRGAMQTNAAIEMGWGDGSGFTQQVSNALLVLGDGERAVIKQEFDPDNGVNRLLDTFVDGAPLGTQIAGTQTQIGVGPAPFVIGMWNNMRNINADIFGVIVRDGPGGPIVIQFDPKDIQESGKLPDGFQFVDARGRTWTVHGNVEMVWTPK